MTTKQTKHSITVGIAKMNKNSDKLVSDDVYIFRDISIKHLLNIRAKITATSCLLKKRLRKMHIKNYTN